LGDSYKIYPALLGGDEESNLVTVAAVTSDGALLAQSNRSSKYVDIAAWGCNVPVIEFDNGVGDFIRRYRSGTSYAAPQVLFTAAMIAREERKGSSRFSPAELKMRLLASADLSVALWEHVKHGRILNTSKAISLHTDVVELQSGEILRGRVKFNDDQGAEVALCGDASVPRSKILKVTNLGQVPEPGARSTIIYARDAAGKFSVLWCNGITASISFEDALTRGTPRDIPFAEIKDIVMASKPYWR
jgi:hypothetical protein